MDENKLDCDASTGGAPCKYDIDIAVMRERQEEMRDRQEEIRLDIKEILVALKGNGKEGLCTRMTLAEAEIKDVKEDIGSKVPLWKKLMVVGGVSTVTSIFIILVYDPAAAPRFSGLVQVILKAIGV